MAIDGGDERPVDVRQRAELVVDRVPLRAGEEARARTWRVPGRRPGPGRTAAQRAARPSRAETSTVVPLKTPCHRCGGAGEPAPPLDARRSDGGGASGNALLHATTCTDADGVTCRAVHRDLGQLGERVLRDAVRERHVVAASRVRTGPWSAPRSRSRRASAPWSGRSGPCRSGCRSCSRSGTRRTTFESRMLVVSVIGKDSPLARLGDAVGGRRHERAVGRLDRGDAAGRCVSRVLQLEVADGTGGLLHGLRHARVAVAALAGRPLDRLARAHLRLPLGALHSQPRR